MCSRDCLEFPFRSSFQLIEAWLYDSSRRYWKCINCCSSNRNLLGFSLHLDLIFWRKVTDPFPSHLQHLLVGVNYKKTPDWDEEVKKITNGNGVDQVIEAGGSSTAAKALACVKRGGLLSAVGFLAQGEKNPDLAVLILKSGANFVSREPNVRTWWKREDSPLKVQSCRSNATLLLFRFLTIE